MPIGLFLSKSKYESGYEFRVSQAETFNNTYINYITLKFIYILTALYNNLCIILWCPHFFFYLYRDINTLRYDPTRQDHAVFERALGTSEKER